MAHPIYIMSAVTSVAALAAWGVVLWQISPRDPRRRYLLALVFVGLLMSPAAFFGVRRPLLVRPVEPILTRPGWQAGGWSMARDAIRLCFAPLTEEPAKLAPWLVLLAIGCPVSPTRRMIAPLALAAGLGFAVGEIWLVAWLLADANDPKLAGLPWYAFGGFLSERLMTCATHSLFALPTVALARRGWKWGAAGLILGMTLHWIGNAPIVLLRRGAFGWKVETWQLLIQFWLTALTITSVVLLMGVFAGRKGLRLVWPNRMTCPECGGEYRQPIFLALNFGLRRYERCGVCHKWHWVTLQNLAPRKR